MLKSVCVILGACVFLILVLNPPSFSQTDSVIATIWLPDKFSGVTDPCAFTFNSTDNKMYVCGGQRVSVISAADHGKIAGITVGSDARALAYNSIRNKVYCANSQSNSITVIDGTGDFVIATVDVGT